MNKTLIEPENVKGKILTVDDQSLNIKILHKLFCEEFEVFMANNGEQAVEVCQKMHPDIVLLDIEMPGMTGFEVCEKLKADPSTADIAIIFITGHFDEAQEAKGFQLGAVDFIHKPINAVITRARVHNQFQLKQQADLLRKIALTDGLTGIANRRQFEQYLPDAWRHCMRYNHPISLIMVDIDFFKRYNDHYGHQEGDECLRQVAQAIKLQIKRPYDLAARYGGEEFVCILTETNLDNALLVAQSLVNSVEELQIEHLDSPMKTVTISTGVASISPTLNASWQPVLEAADQQLYCSKKQGRNQVNGIELSHQSE